MTKTDAETDQRIMHSIKQGNPDALAELYDRHNAWLMAVAFRILKNNRDAEDLLHDVFIEIWKKAASYDEKRGTVSSWLAVKIRSRALDRLRMLNTVNRHIIEQSATEIEYAATTNEIKNLSDHIQAKEMLDQLTPVQRTVIEL